MGRYLAPKAASVPCQQASCVSADRAACVMMPRGDVSTLSRCRCRSSTASALSMSCSTAELSAGSQAKTLLCSLHGAMLEHQYTVALHLSQQQGLSSLTAGACGSTNRGLAQQQVLKS